MNYRITALLPHNVKNYNLFEPMTSIPKALLPILLLSFSLQLFAQIKTPVSIEAPDKMIKAEFSVDEQGNLLYQISCFGKKALTWSSLGLNTNVGILGENTIITASKVNSVNEKFHWTLGENDIINNHYNELTLSCVSSGKPFDMIVRVFNGAVAFRYKVSKSLNTDGNRIYGELTSFHLPKSTTIYQYNQESVFTPMLVDTMPKTCDFPATLRTSDFYYSIGEAENNWYTKAELKKGNESNSLTVAYVRDKEVVAQNEFATPWRTVAISKTAIGLHEFADLYLKLNSTTVKDVPSWIKPGKLIRSQLNTQSGLDCIDFAVKHNLQYIMFDAGWYGHEFRSSSDPTQVIEQMDLPKIISYGKEKGVGVILYVNKVGLYAKLDTILPLYKKWGVAGFKFGFVDGLSQQGISWLDQAIRKVEHYGFILDIHDNYKPTGLSRKYPALLTQEGIRGDENRPDAFHTTTLPFTRFLAGPADFTFCYPNSRESFSKNLKVTKAHQLALSVVYFSPLQSLYWYGKPLDYKNDGEIEFFDQVPTVWTESHYLTGEIGENISVARRSGDTWFMGSVTGLKDWKGRIKLDFLKPGVKYEATVYEDNGNESIRKTTLRVKNGDLFSLDLKAKSGQAVIIRQAK
ncbi:glycoside hydrolase family 97 protein [Parabacteroides sp. FAFU027]|uniref:glycoside hydrolase family 97 protein n=1 Tax=Parabacteroides sp. FAFU027 TaxID=2922715 RepID=UPI001FAF5E51|nr:glycoside hydrolase family 97 protein [Parabacteroides sp. FAFU027]